jgi:hypothetical protein
MHYVNSVAIYICKICKFFYCPSQSFVCYHKIVIKDLKVLNIKILEIQKMVIFLGKLQLSNFFKFDKCIDELDFYRPFDNSKCV